MRHLHEGHNFGGVGEKALCGALISHNYGAWLCGECLDAALALARCERDLPVTRHRQPRSGGRLSIGVDVMKVLIACEYSGIIRNALTERNGR